MPWLYFPMEPFQNKGGRRSAVGLTELHDVDHDIICLNRTCFIPNCHDARINRSDYNIHSDDEEDTQRNGDRLQVQVPLSDSKHSLEGVLSSRVGRRSMPKQQPDYEEDSDEDGDDTLDDADECRGTDNGDGESIGIVEDEDKDNDEDMRGEGSDCGDPGGEMREKGIASAHSSSQMRWSDTEEGDADDGTSSKVSTDTSTKGPCPAARTPTVGQKRVVVRRLLYLDESTPYDAQQFQGGGSDASSSTAHRLHCLDVASTDSARAAEMLVHMSTRGDAATPANAEPPASEPTSESTRWGGAHNSIIEDQNFMGVVGDLETVLQRNVRDLHDKILQACEKKRVRDVQSAQVVAAHRLDIAEITEATIKIQAAVRLKDLEIQSLSARLSVLERENQPTLSFMRQQFEFMRRMNEDVVANDEMLV